MAPRALAKEYYVDFYFIIIQRSERIFQQLETINSHNNNKIYYYIYLKSLKYLIMTFLLDNNKFCIFFWKIKIMAGFMEKYVQCMCLWHVLFCFVFVVFVVVVVVVLVVKNQFRRR